MNQARSHVSLSVTTKATVGNANATQLIINNEHIHPFYFVIKHNLVIMITPLINFLSTNLSLTKRHSCLPSYAYLIIRLSLTTSFPCACYSYFLVHLYLFIVNLRVYVDSRGDYIQDRSPREFMYTSANFQQSMVSWNEN